MRDGKSSAVAAVAQDLGRALAHTTPGASSGDQPDLLREFDDEVGLFEAQAIAPPVKRGPGRPPGSVNRTTQQLQTYLRARGYRDPAEFLASLVSGDTDALAKTLGCDRIEVLKVQRAAAVDLMPYFHQRQGPIEAPRAVTARPLVMIQMGGSHAAAERPDGTLSIHDMQGNQELSLTVEDPSHDEPSHDDS